MRLVGEWKEIGRGEIGGERERERKKNENGEKGGKEKIF